MTRAIEKVEVWLAGVFKNAPVMAKENKKLAVQALPWMSLIFGALQLLSALGLWNWLQEAQRWGLFALPGYRVSQFDAIMVYVSIGLLVVTAALLLLAYAPLRARARRGWELLFSVGVINIASGLVALFVVGRGVVSLIFSVIVSVVIFYFLVQVRDMYKQKGTAPSTHKK